MEKELRRGVGSWRGRGREDGGGGTGGGGKGGAGRRVEREQRWGELLPPGPFLPALMVISQLILLSQNLSWKKDNVTAAEVAAKYCAIRENYQVVSLELKGL